MAAPTRYTLTKEDRSAWRDMLGTPNREKTAFVTIMAVVQMLIIPFSEDAPISLLYLLLTFGFYYIFTRSIFAVLGLALPVFLVYTMDPTIAICFLALLFGGAMAAYILLHFHTKPIHLAFLALPVCTWATAFLLTGDPLRGLLTWLPLPLAAVFAFFLLRCSGFTDTVVAGAAVTALTLAAALLVTLAATGDLAGNSLALLADQLRAQIVTGLSEARTFYEEAGLSYSITDVSIANTAAMIVNLIPALFLMLACVLSFLSYRVFAQIVVALDEMKRMPRNVLSFTVSPTAAILFIVAFLLSLLVGNDHTSLFAVVLQNLYLVLEPGLIVIGFGALAGRGAARSCLSLVILLGLLFILFTNPAAGLTLIAFYGAMTVLASRFFPAPDEKGGR